MSLLLVRWKLFLLVNFVCLVMMIMSNEYMRMAHSMLVFFLYHVWSLFFASTSRLLQTHTEIMLWRKIADNFRFYEMLKIESSPKERFVNEAGGGWRACLLLLAKLILLLPSASSSSRDRRKDFDFLISGPLRDSLAYTNTRAQQNDEAAEDVLTFYIRMNDARL